MADDIDPLQHGRYVILRSPLRHELVNRVNAFIRAGYEPTGGVWIDTADFAFCQSLWMEKCYWVEIERSRTHLVS
jgi:hypothetical protein